MMSDPAPLLEQLRAIREHLGNLQIDLGSQGRRLDKVDKELAYQGQRLSAIEKRFATLVELKVKPASPP